MILGQTSSDNAVSKTTNPYKTVNRLGPHVGLAAFSSLYLTDSQDATSIAIGVTLCCVSVSKLLALLYTTLNERNFTLALAFSSLEAGFGLLLGFSILILAASISLTSDTNNAMPYLKMLLSISMLIYFFITSGSELMYQQLKTGTSVKTRVDEDEELTGGLPLVGYGANQ